MKWIEENPVKVILLAGAAIFLFHLNVLPVTIMEARNFITAREMIVDGNWLLTTMNDLPRYQKPPLPSWLTAIPGLIFGADNPAVLRIPTMIMAIFLGYIGYIFSLKLVENKRHALINALILLSSFYIITITNEAPWDIYTHGFMLAGIYFLYRFFREESKKWKYSLLAAILIGLSFMSKGPVSVYAVLLPFLIAYGIVFRYKGLKQKGGQLVVLLLLAAIISIWWFLYVRWADPAAFLAITKKETGNWSSYNVRPFYYYWSFFTQSGLWTIPAFASLFYPYLKNRVSHPAIYRFTFLWTVLSVVLLSIIPEKKTRYLVPVLIPLALNTGFYIEYAIRAFKDKMNAKERFPVYFHFGLIGLIGIAFPIAGYFLLKDNIEGLWVYFILTSIILFSLGILIFKQLRQKNIYYAFLLTIGFVACIKLTAFPLAKAFQKNEAFNNISSLKASAEKEEMNVYSFGEIAPEMIWHYGASIPLIKEDDTVDLPEENSFAVLVTPVEENEFKRIFDASFNIELKEVFDINYGANPEKRGHKKRLVSKLYLVKRSL
ncbi:phospholipid carrier-dependent glycosyltransferase [Leptobacterium flavescens]|uniref:Phospholipid carrier-dependent glycosyltransferase n=1 Tax=Leptobacterium flavescens TaxID=472055 RepID=A0A6P0UPD2_9FLAO|nr:glycosyltransferase family 39 protein [Leptobacterium flavescens]NER12216.1 phospholipid carrier-dependent glycosyltransferase [Leptobacterium flavescens]